MPDIPIGSEDDRKRVVDFIMGLNLDRPWIVTVKRRTKKRSLSQNGLYWDWMT